ncbi:unnamed protein product, partial [Sphagnum compactum]
TPLSPPPLVLEVGSVLQVPTPSALPHTWTLKYLLAPPHCCFVALLFPFLPCCFTLSIGTPSSLSCASGGAWNNTNKLHPTI